MSEINSLASRYEAWLKENRKHNRPYKRVLLSLIEQQQGWFSTSSVSEACNQENYPFLAKASHFCGELVSMGLLVRVNRQNHIYYRIAENGFTEVRVRASQS